MRAIRLTVSGDGNLRPTRLIVYESASGEIRIMKEGATRLGSDGSIAIGSGAGMRVLHVEGIEL